MNDLVLELWKQAALDESNEDIDDLVQKFAELIVLEVFEIIEEERFEMYPPVLQRVKERFGIE